MSHIPIILTQHAEDAAMLWERRDRAVNAPHYNTMYLGRLDEQLEAHLDGLRVAGAPGWDEAISAFEEIGGGGEVFTLSTLAFGHEDTSRIAPLLERIGTDPSAHVRPAASGIGWLPKSALHGKVDPLLSAEDPVSRALGVWACAVHRVDPGKRMAGFLADAPGVRRRAARLAGEIGRVDLLPQLLELIGDSDGQTAFWASWSALLLGDRGTGVATMQAAAQMEGAVGQIALRLLLPTLGRTAGAQWLDTLPASDHTQRIKVQGYGMLGDAGAIPWLIEQMGQADLAALAGESYAMITGADLEEEDLDTDLPEDAEESPNDDPDDDTVDLDPDENLPLPSVEAISAHWQGIRGRFDGQGWFLGHPASEAAYSDGFRDGYQRQRRMAAHWLAIGQPKAPMPNWQTPVRITW